MPNTKSAPARSVSATWVRGVLQTLAGNGLDVDVICRDAGIDRQAIEVRSEPCPTELLSRLWEVAGARADNPAIGLLVSSTMHPASFDVVGYAMMSSATLYDGLQRLCRYLRLVADDHHVDFKPEGAEFRLTVEIGGGNRPVPAARYDSVFMTLLTFARWMLGRELRFVRMALSQPAPANMRFYQAAFRCPIRFGAPTNCVLLSADDVHHPLPTANPMLIEMLDKLALERLQQLDGERVSARVIELIRRRLPDGEPGRGDIATLLHVSERTLQRQLTEEGTTFQQLLDQTRRELAERYLAQPQVSLGELAYLLGFAEPSIFTRACKRWFQASPSQVRARLGVS